MTDYAELRRLLAEATPSPLRDISGETHITGHVGGQDNRAFVLSVLGRSKAQDAADRALLLAAVNALPDLLARIAELESTERQCAGIIAELRHALRPFAEYADHLHPGCADSMSITPSQYTADGRPVQITYGDCRKAHAALRGKEETDA